MNETANISNKIGYGEMTLDSPETILNGFADFLGSLVIVSSIPTIRIATCTLFW